MLTLQDIVTTGMFLFVIKKSSYFSPETPLHGQVNFLKRLRGKTTQCFWHATGSRPRIFSFHKQIIGFGLLINTYKTQLAYIELNKYLVNENKNKNKYNFNYLYICTNHSKW